MQLLRGAIRTYAWGSRSAIAEFSGRPTPTAHPEAELWLGAHPGDPAHLQGTGGETSLSGAIGADPQAQLGTAGVHQRRRRFDRRALLGRNARDHTTCVVAMETATQVHKVLGLVPRPQNE